MWKRTRLTCGWICVSGGLLWACGPHATPAQRLAAPVTIATATAAAGDGTPIAATVARPTAGAAELLDLVEPDGALMVHVDAAALRDHPLYGGVKAVLSNEESEVRVVTAKCGIHPLDAVGELAVSLHDFHRTYPLVAARLALAPERAKRCLVELLDEAKPGIIAGRGALLVRDYGGTVAVVVVDDLLLIGRVLEVKRALERLAGGGRGGAAARLAAAGLPAGAAIAVVVETGDEEVELAKGSAVRSGPRLELSGEALFRSRRRRTAADYAQRAARELGEARAEAKDKLRGLLGKHHPLIDQLDALAVTVQGARVSGALRLTVTDAMRPAIDAAVARLEGLRRLRRVHDTLGAISHRARAGFERQLAPGPSGAPLHRLCASAVDVPARVPRGTLYQPSDAPGRDYHTGDARHGWRCLEFSLEQGQAFRISYRQGGRYKGPARGGPNPGPAGFEVAAEGDLDGDGKTSLFTRTGAVDKTGQLRISPQTFSVDEYE